MAGQRLAGEARALLKDLPVRRMVAPKPRWSRSLGPAPWVRLWRHRCVSSTGFDGGFELPLSGLLGEGDAVVLGLVLDWRN